MKFETPILFLIFNRLDTTKKVVAILREIKPSNIYIAADGARLNNKGEQEKCSAVREYVLNNIDWECKVKTLFRAHNLGCGKAVSKAISWFFENVDQGIILEDDCLPNLSFFSFCQTLLSVYKDNHRIMHIGGHSIGTFKEKDDEDYFFSAYNHIWGWATWRRAWNKYTFSMTGLDTFISSKKLEQYFRSKIEIEYWTNVLRDAKRIDTWDFQWTYSVWNNNGISILPTKNLVQNIGFGDDATHTKTIDTILINPKLGDLCGELLHPCKIEINFKKDRQMTEAIFGLPATLCPITNDGNLTIIKDFSTDLIYKKYLEDFSIDIKYLFQGKGKIFLLLSEDSKYEFFYPKIEGDSSFYSKLQEFDWYYIPWKWEHEQVLKYLKNEMKILEIGSGSGGFLTNIIKRNSTLECLGLELNESAIDAAKQSGLKLLAESIQDHAEKNPNKYDIVCSFQVLEHVFDIQSFISSNVKTTKQNGLIVFSVPNNNSFLRDDFNILNIPPHHVGLWKEESLRNLEKYFDITLEEILFEPLQKYHLQYFKETISNKLKKKFRIPKRALKYIERFYPILTSNKYQSYTIMVIFRKK